MPDRIIPEALHRFLLGEAPLDGVWFGDKHSTERGAFWWRKHLQAAPSTPEPTPIAWMRRDGLKAIVDLEKQAYIETGKSNIVEDYTIALVRAEAPQAPTSTEQKGGA